MRAWRLPEKVSAWVTALSQALHRRHAWRLLPLLSGLLCAHGRRTVTRWLRAVGIGPGFPCYNYFLARVGRKAEFLASLLLRRATAVVPVGEQVLLGLDDTPTKRYGPHVEGAGIDHNPTPGPADQKFLYGHIWVTLAWVVRHPLWGALGLPVRALLYVRRQDVGPPTTRYGVEFRTKLQQAAALVTWAADW
jgi:hypothetical protein